MGLVGLIYGRLRSRWFEHASATVYAILPRSGTGGRVRGFKSRPCRYFALTTDAEKMSENDLIRQLNAFADVVCSNPYEAKFTIAMLTGALECAIGEKELREFLELMKRQQKLGFPTHASGNSPSE
jgi:hypothetical protein